jgi:hypothetical protein
MFANTVLTPMLRKKVLLPAILEPVISVNRFGSSPVKYISEQMLK